MSRIIPEHQLPQELGAGATVEAAYPDELSRAAAALVRGLPVLIECDKGLVGYFYAALRGRLRRQQIRCNYIDGRVTPQPGQMPMGLVPTMIGQLRDAVRGGTHDEGEERRATDFRVVAYSTPVGNAAAYYPETNVLVPLDHTAARSNTPVSKAVVIRVEPWAG